MTRQEITDYMGNVVDEEMESFQTDFIDYDKPEIENAASSDFPYLWIVSKFHTRCYSLGKYKDNFFATPSMRYAYADGDDNVSYLLDSHLLDKSDRIFIISEDKICEVGPHGANQAIRDYVIPAVKEWEPLYGKLVPKRVRVKFDLLPYAKLRELIQECRDHNDDSLWSILKRFHNRRCVAEDHKITVKYCAWNNEFVWFEHYNGEDHIIGHIVFHGWPETGYMSNGSIQLTPSYGWASHT